MNGSDVSVGATKSFDFIVGNILGQILDKDVVENFSNISFILRLELDSDEFLLVFCLLKSCFAILGI